MSTACTFMPIALFVISLHGDSAQAEIDAVVGPDRLPSFVDRETLPCAEALGKMSYDGMLSSLPLTKGLSATGFPHCVTEDDGGYYIPKGSPIIPNIWCMLDDLRTYDNLSQFNPEHFLTKDGREPETASNNLLRLCICPGLILADASLWIPIMRSPLRLNVDPLSNASGTISHPKPIEYSIKPRSASATELIQRVIN
ncbi:hypothetical protein EDB19DRAFT_1823462 [Suillus lakei]|nr:hypothetical protein EDB19DRAFT_1823462 [Suillus lakei]